MAIISHLIGFSGILTDSYYKELFVDNSYFLFSLEFHLYRFSRFHLHECMEETGFAAVFQLHWHLVFLEGKRNTQICHNASQINICLQLWTHYIHIWEGT